MKRSAICLFSLCFTALFLLCRCSSNTSELHLYCWAGYVKPSLVKQFETEHQCRVVIDTFDSNEAMYAKLRAGASGYDLIIPSSYFVTLMEQQGLLQQIDFSQIPNLRYIDWEAVKQTAPQIGTYGVPYMLGYTGIGYRKDRVDPITPSWSLFANTRLKGRMTMLNDFREAIGASLKQLGYSVNTKDPREVNEAANQVIEWKRNLAKFESEQYKNGIATAEYLVVQAYSSDIAQVEQEDDNVAFLLPEEGVIISHDYFVVPAGAKNIELAYHFINFLQEPKIAAENMIAENTRSPNIGAYAYLDEKTKVNPAFFPPQEILEKSEVLQDLGNSITLYHRAWDLIKESD